MQKMKTKMVAAAVMFGLSQGALAWDVVFDPTAVQQAIQQLIVMKQQYDQMKNQYESLTGNTNFAAGLKVPEIVSGSWQDVVKNQGGAFGSKQKLYDKMLTLMDGKELKKLMDSKQFEQSYQNVRMGMAFSDASYGALDEHVKNLRDLRGKLNQTKTIKEAQDLANAIAIENALIQTITARLSAVQTNLAADSGAGAVTSNQAYSAWIGN